MVLVTKMVLIAVNRNKLNTKTLTLFRINIIITSDEYLFAANCAIIATAVNSTPRTAVTTSPNPPKVFVKLPISDANIFLKNGI